MRTKLPITVASALLLSGALCVDFELTSFARTQNPDPSQSQQAPNNDSNMQMFGGRIARSNGAYILRASSGKTFYMLDDQKAAKHYEGKMVVVTGTMDKTNNLIHVQKIEAVA